MRAIRPRSSLINRIVYDEDARTLAVTFRDARRYIYSGVPRTVYDAFKKAASAGSVFNDTVKGHFPCRPADARRRYPLADS